MAEGLDLGPTFDPEDATDHRYQYVIADNPVSIMPTLDYYGYEHEDAITGEQPDSVVGSRGFGLLVCVCLCVCVCVHVHVSVGVSALLLVGESWQSPC